MPIDIFPVASAAAGRIAVVQRPRGAHWLDGDLAYLRASGVDLLVSALPVEEAGKLWLERERHHAEEAGLEFVHLPVPNLLTPPLDTALPTLLSLARSVAEGRYVAAHCMAGVGRSPLLVASILVLLGDDPAAAWSRIEAARGREVPDTVIQKRWVDQLKQHALTLNPDPLNPRS